MVVVEITVSARGWLSTVSHWTAMGGAGIAILIKVGWAGRGRAKSDRRDEQQSDDPYTNQNLESIQCAALER